MLPVRCIYLQLDSPVKMREQPVILLLSVEDLLPTILRFKNVKQKADKFRSLPPASLVVLLTTGKHFDWAG